jgi:iron(III) transport system substrate-binding protein
MTIRTRAQRWAAWLMVSLVLAACTSAATPAPTAAPTAASTAGAASPSADAMKALVDAATKEGTVVVAGPQGASYTPALTKAFQAKYPGIKVELTLSGGSDMVARILPERDAGKYLVDVGVQSPGEGYQSFKPKGALDPLDAILLPEITQDSKWIDGFKAGWMDKDQKYVYAYVGVVDQTVFVNRDKVPASELSKADDLLNPKWKGQIGMSDPRLGRAGTQRLALMLAEKGEAWVKQLVVDQAPHLTPDNRQLAEWVVRGTYPIGIAVANDQLATLEKEGVPVKQVEALKGDPIFLQYGHAGGGAVWLFNKAPHPNAAKLYINFLLSAEGQTSFSQETIIYNSRRTDVTPIDPSRLPVAGTKYTDVQKEGSNEFPDKVRTLTIQWLGNP